MASGTAGLELVAASVGLAVAERVVIARGETTLSSDDALGVPPFLLGVVGLDRRGEGKIRGLRTAVSLCFSAAVGFGTGLKTWILP